MRTVSDFWKERLRDFFEGGPGGTPSEKEVEVELCSLFDSTSREVYAELIAWLEEEYPEPMAGWRFAGEIAYSRMIQTHQPWFAMISARMAGTPWEELPEDVRAYVVSYWRPLYASEEETAAWYRDFDAEKYLRESYADEGKENGDA